MPRNIFTKYREATGNFSGDISILDTLNCLRDDKNFSGRKAPEMYTPVYAGQLTIYGHNVVFF